MTYTIEKSSIGAGFFIKLDDEIVGWTATPWGARMFIDKHSKNNPLPELDLLAFVGFGASGESS